MLFRQLLGPGFDSLDARLRAIHGATTARSYAGWCSVERGTGMLARLCSALAGLPPSAARLPLRVVIAPDAHGERWRRDFGGAMMRSRLRAAGGLLEEHLGPALLRFRLEARAGVIHWIPEGMSTLGVRWPRAWLDGTLAREWVEEGRYRFEVAARLRAVGLLVKYRGELDVDPGDAP